MQVLDTFSPVGWNSTSYFNNYMEAKKGMKFVADAAHARGMIFRTVPNSVLRLAQLNEDILRQRRDAALPAGANQQAQKKFLRSQQRDATALMVRRMFKRLVTTSEAQAQNIENTPTVPANFYDGVASKLAYRDLNVIDIQRLGQYEDAKVPAAQRNWRTAPYSTLLRSRISNRALQFNIGGILPLPVNPEPQAAGAPLYGLNHYLGFFRDYLRDLIFPPGGVLRKDINLILAFSLSANGQQYIPVGISIYGTCQSEKESGRALPGGGFDYDVVHFLKRRPVDRQENAQIINNVNFVALNEEAPTAFASSNAGLPYYNQAAPAPALRGNNLLNAAGNPLPFEDYNTGAKEISELQNKVYMGNVGEIYVVAADDVISIDYDIRQAAAPGLAPPATTLVGYGTLLMAFTVCMMAAERESRKIGPAGGQQIKRWFPKYAGIVSELAPNTSAMTHAETAVRSFNNVFPSNGPNRLLEIQSRDAAKRGTQRLRNLSRRLGFTSQPVLIADAKNEILKQIIPDFSSSTIGQDDTSLFPYVPVNGPFGPRHLGGEIDYDTYVALYTPSQSTAAVHDEQSDFIPLGKLLATIPKVLNAENGLPIDSSFERICPEGRGKGSIMCM